jgi:hypothetical protein
MVVRSGSPGLGSSHRFRFISNADNLVMKSNGLQRYGRSAMTDGRESKGRRAACFASFFDVVRFRDNVPTKHKAALLPLEQSKSADMTRRGRDSQFRAPQDFLSKTRSR